MIVKKLDLKQTVPSPICLSCDVCCHFLDQDSFMAPVFTPKERERAIEAGFSQGLFNPTADGKSSRIRLRAYDEMFICPAFLPETGECSIYSIRPLDCQIYPFVIVFDEDRKRVLLCVDQICPYTEIEISKFHQDANRVVAFLESDAVMSEIAESRSLVGSHLETVTVIRPLDRLTSYLAQTINN